MKLNAVSIENFKCFRKQIHLNLGKLTLLTGANSSGKSSIIYSILGPLQSGEFPFQFSTNGKYVNMGDFKEIVSDHERKNKIKIGFKLKNSVEYIVNTIWGENLNNNLPKLLELQVNSEYFDLTLINKENKYYVDYTYEPAKDPQNKIMTNKIYKKLLSSVTEVIETVREGKQTKGKKKAGATEIDVSKFLSDMTTAQDIKGFILKELPVTSEVFEKKGGIKLNQLLEQVSKLFSEYDDKINFISSFRLHPERTYLEQTKSKIKINNFGDGYLDQIVIWETKNRNKLNELVKVLRQLELLESIKSKRLEGGRYEITVQIKKGGIDASLSDVGFGISQFLPVIVADLQLPEGSTLFVAQPEIHLHPSVQSNFGDYLITQIKAASKNYVLETHSEYLLNKIRLAIVKGEIPATDVKVYFIDNDKKNMHLHEITFNEKGQILNAPKNFFKTYMMDVMEIAINAVEG